MQTSGWERAERAQKEAEESSGIFLKLQEDGDKAVVAFVGEPDVRELFWNGKTYDDWSREHEAAGERKTIRYKMNVWLPETNEVKIWEFNGKVFADIKKARDKYGLDQWFFEVEREGAKGDTQTRYRILPETRMDDSHRRQLSGLTLHSLSGGRQASRGDHRRVAPSEREARPAQQQAFQTPQQATEALPVSGPKLVDTDTAMALVNRLKALPREQADRFFAAFKIARMRDLPNASVPGALNFINQLESPERVPFDDGADERF